MKTKEGLPQNLKAEIIFNKHSWNALGAISPSKYFCLPAMDEYAAEMAIGFMDWAEENEWNYNRQQNFWYRPWGRHEKQERQNTTADLYQEYLKTIKQ